MTVFAIRIRVQSGRRSPVSVQAGSGLEKFFAANCISKYRNIGILSLWSRQKFIIIRLPSYRGVRRTACISIVCAHPMYRPEQNYTEHMQSEWRWWNSFCSTVYR